jgi:hypothetical protein
MEVCTTADRNARFVVPARKAEGFRAAVRAFAADAGFGVADDRDAHARFINLNSRDFALGVVVTMIDDEEQVFAGFIDDTPCREPLPRSSRVVWDRFLRFMAQRGYRGQPNKFM